MINVKIDISKEKLYLKFNGHTGVAGHSLCCAGASMLVIALMKSLEEDGEEFEKEAYSGYAEISTEWSEKKEAYFRMVERGMQWLDKKYRDGINFL